MYFFFHYLLYIRMSGFQMLDGGILQWMAMSDRKRWGQGIKSQRIYITWYLWLDHIPFHSTLSYCHATPEIRKMKCNIIIYALLFAKLCKVLKLHVYILTGLQEGYFVTMIVLPPAKKFWALILCSDFTPQSLTIIAIFDILLFAELGRVFSL